MKQRIITGLIAALLFLPIVYFGGLLFTILIYVMASVCLYEILRMKHISITSFPGIISLLILWLFLLPTEYVTILAHINMTKLEFVLMFILLFLTYSVMSKNQFTFEHIGFCLLAITYIGIGFYYFHQIRFEGVLLVFFALILIWGTDSGAYFIGRSLGKRKLLPAISPKKTVEGSVGGIVTALVIAILFYLFSQISEQLPLWELLLFSLILSIFGQIGDLVESALKRHFQVKDSGTILPGHGGMLDRVDSWLFVMPLFYFLLRIFA